MFKITSHPCLFAGSRRIVRNPRTAVLLVLGLLLTGGPSAEAIDIVLDFNAAESLPYIDGDGIERTPDLQLTFAVAAAMWTDIFEDNHTLTIHYWFADVSDPVTSGVVVVNGRIVEANIRIPVDAPYYFDPDPLNHDEFNMAARLYRDTHPAEQAEAFSGVPPEIFEVGYNGYSDNLIDEADLLTVVFHEMGHALGLGGGIKNPPCSVDPYYWIDPVLVGGAVVGLKGYEDDNGFDCSHLALGGIQECAGNPFCESHQALMWTGALPDARQLPDTATILTIATVNNFTQVDLPRKFSLGSGLWGSPDTWLGHRVPDAEYDDVYVINTPATTVSVSAADAFARNLILNTGNTIEVGGPHKLDVLLDADITNHSTLRVDDPAGEVEISHLNIQVTGELAVDAGLADVFDLYNIGVISGSGLIQVVALDNYGEIRSSGGVLDFTTSNPNGACDLDGLFDTPATLLDASNGSITFQGPWADDAFAGSVLVGPGRFIAYDEPLTFAGPVSLDGGGSEALIDGPTALAWPGVLSVNQTGRFADQIDLQFGAQVDIPDADDTLVFDGPTYYRGASFSGQGLILQNGDANVQSDTTVDVAYFDMDGTQGVNAVLTVWPDVTFTINTNIIESPGLFDGYDGQLFVVKGTLEVNTALPWALQGSATLSGLDGVATLAGSDIDLSGTISAVQYVQLLAGVNITGTLDTFDPNSIAELASGSINQLAGGAVTGTGTLRINADTTLQGNGTADPDLDVAGTLRATGGTLTVHGNFIDLGTVGTLDHTGTLEVTHPWSTLSDGLLDLRGGVVTGGDITNTATTAGFGTIGAGRFTNRGLLAPGSWEVVPGSDTGILQFLGDFTQIRVGTVEIGIRGTTPGTEHDQLAIRGQATLGATMDVVLLDGYVPACGDSFTVMTYGSVAGDFDTYTGLVISPDLALVPVVGPTELVLVASLNGDLNGDGVVDLGDLAILLAHYGMTEDVDYTDGDLDEDGDVDLGDLSIMLSRFGQSCP